MKTYILAFVVICLMIVKANDKSEEDAEFSTNNQDYSEEDS